MAGGPSTFWSEKIVKPFRASPQKAAVLGGLGILLVVLWMRLLVGSHGPNPAQGAPSPQFGDSPSVDDPSAGGARRSQSQALSFLQWTRQPITPVRRNLFAVPLDYYPRDGTHVASELSDGNGFWDQLAKSMSSQADQQEQRQILIDNVRTKAAALTLQSTIMGDEPTAMVDGTMVREGSVVEGFRVLKIEARRIMVESQGIKLEITMK
jgi:hypothetical protein